MMRIRSKSVLGFIIDNFQSALVSTIEEDMYEVKLIKAESGSLKYVL